MNAIKNALVTTTLIAVGYGVYVILANPSTAPEMVAVSGDSPTWQPDPSATGGTAGWQEMQPPQLSMEGGAESGSQNAGMLDPAGNSVASTPTQPPIAPAATGDIDEAARLDLAPSGTPPAATPATSPETAVPPAMLTAGAVQDSAAAPRQVLADPAGHSDNVDPEPNAANPYLPASSDAANASADHPFPSAASSPPPPDSFSSGAATTESVANDSSRTTANQPDVVSSAAASGLASPELSQDLQTAANNAFNTAWQTSQRQMQNGEMANALFTLSIWYEDPSLDADQRARCLKQLDELAAEVIYSRQHHLLPAYVVRSGDTLEAIANQFQVPLLFLARVNGISSPFHLQPGESIKVVQGPFRAEIDTRRREMTLFAGSYYAGRFPLHLGQDASILKGQFQVASQTLDPSYIHPQTKQQIPGGDPANPYGRVWLGLRNETSPPDFRLGLHGSQAGDATDSRGSIRLSSQDIEDVHAILSLGSPVFIR